MTSSMRHYPARDSARASGCSQPWNVAEQQDSRTCSDQYSHWRCGNCKQEERFRAAEARKGVCPDCYPSLCLHGVSA